MNHPRISAEVVDRIEGVMDALQEAHSDGEVTASEVIEVMDLMWSAYQTAMHADQGVRLAVTAARSGPGSASVYRQLREFEIEEQRARPRLRVIRGGRPDDLQAS